MTETMCGKVNEERAPEEERQHRKFPGSEGHDGETEASCYSRKLSQLGYIQITIRFGVKIQEENEFIELKNEFCPPNTNFNSIISLL